MSLVLLGGLIALLAAPVFMGGRRPSMSEREAEQLNRIWKYRV